MLFATKLLVGQCKSDQSRMVYAKVVDIDTKSSSNFAIESEYSVRFALNAFDPDNDMFSVTRVKDDDDDGSIRDNVRSFEFDESDNVDPLTLKFEVKRWIANVNYPLRDGREYSFNGFRIDVDGESSVSVRQLEVGHSFMFVYELPASKRDIRIAIEWLTAVKPGPALPKVLAELIVSYITG